MTPRPLRYPDEDKALRALVKLCHPKEREQPKDYYFVHPTLVAVDGGELVGYTSFAVAMSPLGGFIMYGKDVGVHPARRGEGLARLLCDARLAMGRKVGAQRFIGITSADNTSMARILEAQGMHACQVIPHHYGYADGVVYSGPIGAA